MNPEIKKKWLKALRSGKYKQTRERLKAHNGAMCCLGVLEHKVLGVPYTYYKPFHLYSRSDSPVLGMALPSEESLSKAGVDAHQANHLADLNDSDKLSFSEIADWIEENL